MGDLIAAILLSVTITTATDIASDKIRTEIKQSEVTREHTEKIDRQHRYGRKLQREETGGAR